MIFALFFYIKIVFNNPGLLTIKDHATWLFAIFFGCIIKVTYPFIRRVLKKNKRRMRKAKKKLKRPVKKKTYVFGATKNQHSKLIKYIKDYVPPRNFSLEEMFQSGLYAWLQQIFPDLQYEEQRGSSRPDLSWKDIAIEVKGPTSHRDLQSVADKYLRYKKHFAGGLIVVMFDLQVSDRLFKEWRDAFTKEYPQVVLIVR